MRIKKNVFWLILLLLLNLTGCTFDNLEGAITDSISTTSDKLIVHYIDVGQGDATLIELPNGEVMLIDAGEKEYGRIVENYIEKLNYDEIDYLVGTHPHSDHIGGLKTIVDNFNIGKIYMPKKSSTSNTYLNLLKAIDNKGLSIINAKAGLNILSTTDLSIDVIGPVKNDYSSLNNYSVMIKIKYKDRTFLFTGDTESDAEDDIINEGYNVQADVLKVSHHGSDTSSSSKFITSVSPTYAIISVGEDNSYNHPSSKVIDLIEKSGAKIYQTKEEGTIKVTSDGEGILVSVDDIVISNEEIATSNKKKEDVEVISLTDPIKKGSNVTLSIKGKANTTYSISVYYKSGKSNASGLNDKESDDEGNVSWTWKVSNNVIPGTYKIIIDDKEREKEISYTIVD